MTLLAEFVPAIGLAILSGLVVAGLFIGPLFLVRRWLEKRRTQRTIQIFD